MNGTDFKNLDSVIATREKDIQFPLSSGKFDQILDIKQNTSDCRVISNTSTENLLIDACDLKMINAVYIRNLNNASRKREIQEKDALCKAACFPYKDGIVITSFLHDIC